MRGRVTRWFNGQMQYTLSRVQNDTNGIAWFPANDYDLSGEWARAISIGATASYCSAASARARW